MSDYTIVWLPVAVGIIVSLIVFIWHSLNSKVDKKLDKETYLESISHIQKAVDGINGTAKTLIDLAGKISEIQTNFMTLKDFEYEMKLHQLSCKEKKND